MSQAGVLSSGGSGPSGPAIQTLSDVAGNVVHPIGSPENIELVGYINEQGATTFQTVTGVPASHLFNLNPMSVARWIVDPLGFNGTHTTIASALTSATSGDTIFVMDGTYTENLTLKAGVNLTAFTTDEYNSNVVIIGNVTANYSGTAAISGICLQTNGAAFLTCSGSNSGLIYLLDCLLLATNSNGMAIGNSNFAVYIVNSFTRSSSGQSLFAVTATSGVEFDNCRIGALDSTANTISGNTVEFINSTVGIVVGTSSTGSVLYRNCKVFPATNITCFTTSGTGTATFTNCSLESQSATCGTVGAGTTVTLSACSLSSSNTNVISGTGTLAYSTISFYGSSTQFANTLTLSLLGSTPANSPAGYLWTSTGTNTTPTWQAMGGGGFTWVDATSATQALLAQHGYVTDRGGGVTYTLPASGTLGDVIKIVGKLGLGVITPNANQQILIGSVSGTVGATGTATSNNVGDCIELVCITAGASTVWRADSVVGTWTLA